MNKQEQNKQNSIYIFDMDGTLINSMPAIKKCQLKGLEKATRKERSQLEKELDDFGFKNTVIHNDMDLNTFFKDYYKTFDPYEAKKQGEVYLFKDVEEVLEEYKNNIKVLISNSSISATKSKLNAFDLLNQFDYVFAETESKKCKPNLYMGEKALRNLNYCHELNQDSHIIMVGDQEIDVEFGNQMKNSYDKNFNNKMTNVLIDRKGDYKGSAKPDATISRLTELYNIK